jgi:hypothetical protein
VRQGTQPNVTSRVGRERGDSRQSRGAESSVRRFGLVLVSIETYVPYCIKGGHDMSLFQKLETSQ